MVKIQGVLGKPQSEVSLIGASWNYISWSVPARIQILVGGRRNGGGNITYFDHCCIPSAYTNISTKGELKYSQREEREGKWEEEELIHFRPSPNIQIPSNEIIYFSSTSAWVHSSKSYCSGCNGKESVELMRLPSGFFLFLGQKLLWLNNAYIWSLIPWKKIFSFQALFN